MPLFRYEARDKQGRTVSGELDGADRLQASLKLREEGLWIVRLEPAAVAGGRTAPGVAPATLDRRFVGRGLRPAHLRDFFDQLGELLEAGVNVYEAMTALPERVTRRLRPVVSSLAEPLAHGKPLSDELARFPHVFAPATVGLVRAGERSGWIGAMCRLVAEQYQQDHRVWISLLPARIYGAVLLPLAILIPTFPWIIARGAEWYLYRALTLLLPLIVGLFVLDWLARVALRQPWAAGLRQDLLWYLPGVAGYLRSATLGRALTVMEAVTQAGGSFAEALILAAQAAGPGRLGRQLARAAEQVRAGRPLAAALGDCPLLPYHVRSALATADQAGGHEATLGRLAGAELEQMRVAPSRVALLGNFGGLVVFAVITAVAVAWGYLNYVTAVLERAEEWMP